MYFQTLSKFDILHRLEGINSELVKVGSKAQIIIVGGSALSLLTKGVRATTDIDYLGALPLNGGILSKYAMSNDVERIFVVPDVTEMSFAMDFNFSNLAVYVLSWEDLAIMKFYSTRQRDLEDLESFILPNIQSFSSLEARLHYYKPDYPFDLNSPDLNLSRFGELVKNYEKNHKVVFIRKDMTLESALKSARVYSKFMRYETHRLNKQLALSSSILHCLTVIGFSELLRSATGKTFRVW